MADELDRREDRELDAIHHQMEQTRANLGNKLEKLEAHVMGTVNSATETVSDAVEGVKDVVHTVTDTVSGVAESVSETVSTVGDAFNLPKQIDAHPLAAVGVAFGVGFIGSLLLGSSEKRAAPSSSGSSSGSWFPQSPATGAPSASLAARSSPSSSPSASAQSKEPGPVGLLWNYAAEGVTDLSLNAILNVVRELTASLPDNFQEQANKFVDTMATDLGVPRKYIAANPPHPPHSQGDAADGAPQQGRHSDESQGRSRVHAGQSY